MITGRKFESPAIQHVYDRHVGRDPERVRSFEDELVNAEIAQRIHDLRVQTGLSQRELAKRVGTAASVICRLENADYQGHSVSMLRRIAAAVGKRLDVRFVEQEPEPRSA
jgi:ribosome-binding protein aMBF1 (putative translation factor)